MKKTWKYLLIISVVGLIFMPTLVKGQFFFFEHPLVGKDATNFSLRNLNGETKSLNDLRANNKAIVFFWATWCPHCRRELKSLNAEKERISKKGIKIVLVDIGETKEMINSYFKRYGIEMEVLLDEEGEVSEQYSVVGLPTYVFIDQTGKVTAVEHALSSNYEKLF